MAATATELRLELFLRRRRQIRFAHSSPYDRRKKKTAGFDVAAALEMNLDRFPTKDAMLALLQRWLGGAAKLVESRPD